MKRVAFCFFILAVVFCQSPFGAADGIESTDVPAGTTPEIPVDIAPAVPADTAPADTTQTENVSMDAVKNSGSASPAVGTDGKETESGEAASSTAGADGKEAENDKQADLTFASIHSKGLTVADGNKWYYESFDRQGRSSFAVFYNDGTAVEKTEWAYKGRARHPTKKKILRTDSSEIFCYDDDGRELSIEQYEQKTLTSKTENIYNGGGKLIEQTITAGKNIDKSIWEFDGDKAISQTKYRNGKKTALIELDNTPHIIHLYIDDKEVYVGEEP